MLRTVSLKFCFCGHAGKVSSNNSDAQLSSSMLPFCLQGGLRVHGMSGLSLKTLVIFKVACQR